VVAGSVQSYASGVICDLSPDDGIADLHRRVRSVLRAVRGPQACQYEWGVQNLTIGFAHGEADSDEAQRRLRRVRPVRRSSCDSTTGSSLVSAMLPADRVPEPTKSPPAPIVMQNDSRGDPKTQGRVTSRARR
jgi:hypothetical protein